MKKFSNPHKKTSAAKNIPPATALGPVKASLKREVCIRGMRIKKDQNQMFLNFRPLFLITNFSVFN
ncbi:MAG: hypothetical protein ACQEQC_02695 [Elusimicrobiota bacterium]